MNDYERAIMSELERQGFEVLRTGWPDFLVLNSSWTRGFALELKAGNDPVRPTQARMHEALARFGVLVHVLRDVDAKEVRKRGRVLLQAANLATFRSRLQSLSHELRNLTAEQERLAAELDAASILLPEPPESERLRAAQGAAHDAEKALQDYGNSYNPAVTEAQNTLRQFEAGIQGAREREEKA